MMMSLCEFAPFIHYMYIATSTPAKRPPRGGCSTGSSQDDGDDGADEIKDGVRCEECRSKVMEKVLLRVH